MQFLNILDVIPRSLYLFRQEGQGSSNDLKSRDFRKDLEDRERTARERRTDRDYSMSSSASSSSAKRARVEHAPPTQLDADDPIDQVRAITKPLSKFIV